MYKHGMHRLLFCLVVILASPPASAGEVGTVTASLSDKGAESVSLVSSCASGCACDQCESSSWLQRSYGGLEYLLWWNKGRSLPILVTGGDPTTTAFADAGVLPGAPVRFGGNDVGTDVRSGARLTVGLWFDDCQTSGALVRVFGGEGDRTNFSESSTGNPILAVPFNDRSAAFFGSENALVMAYSGGLTPGIDAQGNIAASASNDVLGSDVLIRHLLHDGCRFRLDLLGGYQFSRIDDDLTLDTNFTRFDLAGSPQFRTSDVFDVSNEFHAGELGLLGEFSRGRWTIQMMGKIGLGNMRQRVRISGSNTVTSGGSVTTPGGIFAQTTPPGGGPGFNIGTHERDVLVWSPEANFRASYCVSDRLSLSVGYTILYWTRVALAGDQVDRRVNRDVLFGGAFLPGGGSNPAFVWNDTDFWVQSLDLGFTFTF